MNKTMQISFNTDDQGFLSQECPACMGRFKVRFGEGSDQPIGFCPYCGNSGQNCWWTSKQAEYLSAKASSEMVAPELEKMARDFNRRVGGKGLFSMSMKVSKTSVPPEPIEANEDWSHFLFKCCGETIRYDGDFRKLHCIICGKQVSVES